MGKIDGGLRSLFRQHLPWFDWQSIESGLTGGGIPDSNYCIRGVEGWVEFKKTTGWTVGLEPEQVGWIARRHRCGGRVFVAVRQQAPAGPRRAARDVLWLVRGAYVKELKVEGLDGPLCRSWGGANAPRWPGGPAAWDWRAVGALLARDGPRVVA